MNCGILNRNNIIKNKLVIIYAIFIVCYYIFPKNIGFIIEFIILLCSIYLNGFPNKNIRPIIWFGIFSLILGLLEILKSDSLTYLISTINCFIFVVITATIIRDRNDIKVFFTTFGLSGIIFCLYLLPHFIEILLVGRGRYDNFFESDENGFLTSSISIAYLLSLLAVTQIWLLFQKEHRFIFRILIIGALLLSIGEIMLSGTRKALLMIFLFILLYAIISNWTKKIKIIKYLLILTSILFIVIECIMNNEILYNIIGSRLEGVFALFSSNPQNNIDKSTLERIELIDKSINMIIPNNPICGIGSSAVNQILGVSHSHNNYLTLICFGGIVSFVAYYYIYIKMLYWYIKKVSKKDIINSFCLSLIFCLLFTDISATTFNILYFQVFITVIIINIRIFKYCK